MAAAWMAAASVVGGLLSSSAQTSAAGTSSAAAEYSANLQMQQYEQNMGYEAPARNLGYGADNLLAQLYGMPQPYSGAASTMPPGSTIPYGTPGSVGGSPGSAASGTPVGSSTAAGQLPSGFGNNMITGYGVYANGSGGYTANPNGGSIPAVAAKPASLAPPAAAGKPNYSAFFNSPGYQFSLNQGEQAVSRSAAAGGNLYGSNTLNQLDTTAQGYASQQYQQYVNQLNSMAGLGQTAVAGGVYAGTSAAQSAGNFGVSAGNASAAGQIGSANALAGGINAAAYYGSGYYNSNSLVNPSSSGGGTNLNYNTGPGNYTPAYNGP